MKKTDYQKYFKGKKVTIMGLGLLGRGVQVTAFLAECGAKITVTDMKSKKDLAPSLSKLKRYKNIRYVLGGHTMSDFENADIVVKAPAVPLDSPYIARARKNGADVVMDASLFARLAKGVKIVGVTGTRGKSMVTMLAYHILKKNEGILKKKVYLGGNVRDTATLPLLKKVKKGDIVVLELDSWQLQGFGDEKISPEVAVFTSFMPDHMNYYRSMKEYFADKANIFRFQKKGDTLIVRPDMKKLIKKNDTKEQMIVADMKNVKAQADAFIGEHNLENAACAYEVAKRFGLKDASIQDAMKSFRGLEGRLQNLGVIRGITVINDNNATTPAATVIGLESVFKAFGTKPILIAGGNDKKLSPLPLQKAIAKYAKEVIWIPGTGTKKMKKGIRVKNLKDAVKKAFSLAHKGDIVLFSPAFSSFSQYANEYERNDEFVKIIKRYKKL